MKTGIEFLKNLLNAILPNRAAPVLARVMKVYEGPGKNKYSCDVKVLTAGSLEETDQEIAEVPINPIWASKKNRGVYAIPGEGQVVIIEFLEWNIAYPYVSGIWSDEYEAGEFHKDEFVITDGDGMILKIDAKGKIILIDTGKDSSIKLEDKKITVKTDKSTLVLREDKFSEKNKTESLYLVLKDLMQAVHDLIDVAGHTVNPISKLVLMQLMVRLAALMEE